MEDKHQQQLGLLSLHPLIFKHLQRSSSGVHLGQSAVARRLSARLFFMIMHTSGCCLAGFPGRGV